MSRSEVQISVIITAYNEAARIGQAIKSILVQSDIDIELIVVDDGSIDNTVQIVKNINDPRILLIESGRVGRAQALIRGAQAACGQYIANLDADDEALPERLQKQAAFLHAYPDVAWVGSAEEMVDERRGERFVRRYPEEDAAIRRQSAKSIPYSHSAVMFRRSLLDEGLNYDPEQPYLIDFEFFLRVAERHRVANLAEPLVRRHVRGASYFQSRFSTGRQNRRLARLCARAVRMFGLPPYYYLYPVARLGYPWLPNGVKRWVRNVQGLTETHV